MVELKCSGLLKKYEEKRALGPLNLDLKLSGITSIIGRNGAGKTTFIRILATELMPTKGRVELDGIDVINNPSELRNKIAIVPQESRPIPWMTPIQIVSSYLMLRGVGLKEAKMKAVDALKTVGLDEKFFNKLSHKLSGGMKRELMLATVIASDAKIIFLDEPTTGLDPISRKEVWRVLNKLKKDRLIILTTHYLEEAESLSDYIILINKGKVISAGTFADLSNSLKYPYSIRASAKRVGIRVRNGVVIKSEKGMQILTTEKSAKTIIEKLIKKRVEFSFGKVSLDDIFYTLVGKEYENEE